MLVKPSPTSGSNFEGSHLQNYNAFSIVVWTEMSDTAFAICQRLKHDSCVFTIHKLRKTSRPGKHVSALTFRAYFPDNRLCPIVCLSDYVKRTSELRKGTDQLLVSFQKPYRPVSTDMISRWLKTVLAKSGIDTSVFKGHSTRAASTSAAAVCKVPFSIILDNEGRSNATTFGRFYKNPIVPAVKLMDSSCWKTCTHRIVTVFFPF